MTREYELVYIFDSTLEEAQINERLERFHEFLKSPEAPNPVSAANHWGKRTLAYPVDGREVGYYVVVQFETQPERLVELERALKLDDAVLRYLVVLNEGLPAAAIAEDAPSTDGSDNESTGADVQEEK
ncbi:MAG: 30S ribosomal protein S6 [Gemmatimonadota bacterium]|nr:30S ribosomal protein S6 [Gemmatimonadota bacterium]